MHGSIDSLFHPERIAVIGASSNPEKMGFQIFRNIVEAGYRGEILPVNPKGEPVLGRPSLKSASDLPEGTDLAVLIIPAKMVPGTMLQLGERKVRSAIVISGGFAESGDAGAALQGEMSANAAKYGIRVVGPNCQGVNYPYHGVCASWPLITRRGDIAFISQSGTVGAAMIDWASEDRLGFSAFVSMGNRADVDEADLIAFFSEDPNTKVISLYIEGVKDSGRFLGALGKCRKPVVIFKAGRTERGRKAAESHTRSLAGRDEIYDAVFRQYGVHRAHSLEDLYDFSKALAYLPAPNGQKMLIVTSSGGSAIIATDAAEEEGFRVTPLPPELAEKLREMLPSHCIVGNPLDLTGDTDAARYRKVLDASASHYDVVMTIFGDPIAGASEVITPGRCELVSYLGGADVERAERSLLHEKKIAVFPTPERAVRALSCHARFRREIFQPAPAEAGISAGAEDGKKALSTSDSMRILAEAGFPVIPFLHAKSEEETVTAAGKLGYPVAVKVNSPDISHKSDMGGVLLGITGEKEARQAFRDIAIALKRLGARDEGVIVSKMAAPGREVIVGVVRDLQFGPAVLFGMGGVLVEAMGDVSIRVVPLSEKDAAEMIGEIRGSKLLKGFRGGKPADTAAIRSLLLKVSSFAAAHPEISELDFNPVIVYEKGLSIVDARIIPSGTP